MQRSVAECGRRVLPVEVGMWRVDHRELTYEITSRMYEVPVNINIVMIVEGGRFLYVFSRIKNMLCQYVPPFFFSFKKLDNFVLRRM